MNNEKPKILLVDDEKANLKVLSDLLKDEAQIYVAKSGFQALEKANKLLPDLILLDVVMPDMDGFEVIKQLKSTSATQMIPVIFVTGLTDLVFEEKGLGLGACDYILKPYHSVIVKARVKLHLQLVRQRKLLEKLALIDPLTTIANRRKYEEVLDLEWRSTVRAGSCLSIAMIDVDNFKQFNDRFGHPAGDEVLERIAKTLAQQLNRAKDFIARYGGEEFIILLPDTDGDGAKMIMNHCRVAIENMAVSHTESLHRVVTVSVGGVSIAPTKATKRADVLLQADKMLYEAKQKGRNTVVWKQLDTKEG